MTTTTFPNNSLAHERATSATPRAAGFGSQLWNALARLGARRAATQMQLLARQYDTSRPELARLLRDASRNGLNG